MRVKLTQQQRRAVINASDVDLSLLYEAIYHAHDTPELVARELRCDPRVVGAETLSERFHAAQRGAHCLMARIANGTANVTRRADAVQKNTLALALRREGATLDEIGDALGGVTRERARQRLQTARVDGLTTLDELRGLGPYGKLDPALMMGYVRTRPITSFGQWARTAKTSPKQVQRLAFELGLMTAIKRLFRMRRLGPPRQRTAEQLRALAAQGIVEAGAVMRHAPSVHGHVYRYFGGFSRARSYAGLSHLEARLTGTVRAARRANAAKARAAKDSPAREG